MEFEFWWLLAFPLFFGLGWLAARIDIKQLLTEYRSLPASYFKGLNFLLNEQPDKAIEAFIEVVSADSETVELNFALGSLFRRRGEVERAIRMHQNLLGRADLDKETKTKVLFELGQDYLKAGLLDRAEKIFLDLRETAFAAAVLQFLLEIYQREKEWYKAIEVANALINNSGKSLHQEIAHFYCEIALNDHANASAMGAETNLKQALSINRDCVRANILLGDFAAQANRHEEAIQYWRKIEAQSAEHLPLVAEKFLASYQALGKIEDGLNLLRYYLNKYSSLPLLNVVFQSTLTNHGVEAAYVLVRDELRRHPTLHGLDKLLEAELLKAPLERRQDIQLIKGLVQDHARRLALYHCTNCGFKAKLFYWQCPACGLWDTFPTTDKEQASLAKAAYLS